jgi:hypothetical protein
MYKSEWGRFLQADTEIQNVYYSQALNHYAYARNNPFLYIDLDGHNFRIYYDREGASGFGHVAIGVDDANNPGVEIFYENSGIGKEIGFTSVGGHSLDTSRNLDRISLSFSGDFLADTERIERKFRDEEGNIILPKDYDDVIEFEQGATYDTLFRQTGDNQVSQPWFYHPTRHSSLDFAINIIQSGYQVTFSGNRPDDFFKSIKNGKSITSAYKVVNGEKRYKVRNKGRGRSTGNAYCKKGCD